MDVNDSLLASIYFNQYEEKILHTRHVYSLMDFLGDTGGVVDIIKPVFMLIFGKFIVFNTKIETIISMYNMTQCNKKYMGHEFDNAEVEGGIVESEE